MSAVKLELNLWSAATPVERLIADAFRGALSGLVAPVHIARGDDDEAKVLLEGESYSPELFATKFSGAPIIWSVGQEAAALKGSAKLRVWCAVQAGFPIGDAAHATHAPQVAPYLRFAVPDGSADGRFLPLAVLEISERRLVLDFALGGAPFTAPPSVDRGGPIDQAWARCADVSRACLERACSELEAIEGVHVQLR